MKKNGFTLVELLLVVALTALAVGVTGDILVSLIRGYNKTNVINEIEQNANFISQKMNKEIRNAVEIVQLDTAGTSPPTQGETSTEVTFVDRDGITINYTIANDIITRNYDSGGDEPLNINLPPNGVKVSCPGGVCFTLLEDNPQVLQISIMIEQAGDPSTVVFQGDIMIEDTVVIRDTY
jgi:prepilin-type N-terminal cleavage/methylation domain-containing protein